MAGFSVNLKFCNSIKALRSLKGSVSKSATSYTRKTLYDIKDFRLMLINPFALQLFLLIL
jgi:hypothetical protein